MTPTGESGAPRLLDNTTAAALLVLSLALWALPLLVYAHRHSGQPGNAELPGDLGALFAEVVAVSLLIVLVPTGLALLARLRLGYGLGIGVGISAPLFAVIASITGAYRLGPLAVLVLLHSVIAGAGIVSLLMRRVGRDLRGVGTSWTALQSSINSATRPAARPVVWGLFGMALLLEIVRVATDKPPHFIGYGVPRSLHGWVLHLAALSVVCLGYVVIRKNRN